MATVGEAWVDIKPSARGFGSQLDRDVSGEVTSVGKSAGSKFGTALKVGALAAIGGALAVGKFLSGAIADARESEKIGARTENVIKSMGNAARISADDVGKLATAISNKTGVDDEAIQSGQNLLLTFGNIKNVVGGEFVGTFNRASYLMTDIAAAMGTDAKGAAIQLGKALNDPTAGISSLTRVGVSFTEQQKEQIKTLQESGDTVGAQNIILNELQKQFGGAAEAMATPADKLKVVYGNLKEQIGTALIPIVDKFINLLLAAAPSVSAAISAIGPAFRSVQDFLAPFVAQITGLFGGGGGSSLLASIGSFAQSIGTQVVPLFKTMGETFTNTVLPAIVKLGGYLAENLFPIFQQVAGIIRDQVVPILVSVGEFMYGTLYPAIINVAKSVGEKLKPVFDALFQVIKDSVLPAIKDLLEKFREYQPTIQKVIEVVVKIIGKVLEFAAAILANVLPPVIKFAGFLLEKVVPAVAAVIGVVVKIIGKVIDFGGALIDGGKKVGEFAGKVVDLAQRGLQLLIDAVTALPDKIIALGGKFLNAGKSIIGQFVEGLKNAGGVVSDIAGNVWNALKGLLNNAIGRINAALQFTIAIPGAPDISINPPDIPYLAKGTNNFAGGLAVVGEKGPELVNLPRGSQVVPNNVAFGGASAARSVGLGGSVRLSKSDLDYLIAGLGGAINGAASGKTTGAVA